jgi:hypothetical protein
MDKTRQKLAKNSRKLYRTRRKLAKSRRNSRKLDFKNRIKLVKIATKTRTLAKICQKSPKSRQNLPNFARNLQKLAKNSPTLEKTRQKREKNSPTLDRIRQKLVKYSPESCNRIGTTILFVFRTRLFSTQDVGLAYVTFYHNSLL